MHGYEISTDPARLDVARVHAFLAEESYWAPGVRRDRVERSIAGSLCFGLYAPDGAQAGFARAVTDSATTAYLADVFVVSGHRGRGLGVWLVQTVLEHPELRGVGWLLRTRDAQALYARFGFLPEPQPSNLMVRRGAL